MAFYLSDIYTILLFLSTFIFGILTFSDKNRLFFLLQYPFNQKYSLIYHRTSSVVFSLLALINILILVSIPISIYFFSTTGIMSPFLFVKIVDMLTCFVLMKIYAPYLLGFVFEWKDFGKKHYYSYTTKLFFCSMIFLPIILFVSYFKEGLIIIQAPFTLSFIFGFLYFILKIIMLYRLNLFVITFVFYNILYLCSLELLPYLILFHLIRLVF